MSENENEIEQGWAKPKGSTTYHFFRNHQSLCERPRKCYDGVLIANASDGMKCQNCIKALSNGNGKGKTAFMFVREKGVKK